MNWKLHFLHMNLVLGGGAPQYEREYSEPEYFEEIKKFDADSIAVPEDLKSSC